MKKQPYTITTLIYPPRDAAPVESSTDTDQHRSTHAAGIPQFHLEEYRLTALKINFLSDPDPIDPALPSIAAQNAALRHLKAEIAAKYHATGQVKYKLEPTVTPCSQPS